MDNQENKCTALIPYEKPEIVRAESFIERKRRELREAMEKGQVHDPFSIGLGTTLLYGLITTGAGIGLSLLASTLTPKQKLAPQQVGRQSGRLSISSQLGQLISEVYFGDPGDGLGGTLVPAMVICLDPSRPIDKQDSISRQPVGGGKGFGGQQTQDVQTREYFFPFLSAMFCKGPARPLKIFAHADVIYDLYGQISKYEGEAGTHTAPFQIVAYESASGGSEVTLQNHASGSGGAVQWDTVQSNGAATRQLRIRFRTSLSTPMPIEYTINGGTPVAVTLPTSNESYQWYSVSVSLNDGLNTVKIQNKSTTYNLGIDQIYCFPGHTNTSQATGVFDSTVAADTPYDHYIPPSPPTEYDIPRGRFDGMPSVDTHGVLTGTLLFGGQFASYPGNDLQMPDPTMEAAIDALYGEGSTPAYRNRAWVQIIRFFLTRWAGVLPNLTALYEHETIRTLQQFCEFQCTRVGITSYDFSALSTIKPRGYRRLGQRYQAGEPMVEAGELFDCYYYEEDGVLTGELKYPASVATLTEEDFGWVEGDELPEGPLSLLDVVEPNEIDIPQRLGVKHLDLDRDGEPGYQEYGRQIVEGREAETLDYSDWTLTRDEAQAEAQKELYRLYVEKPVRPFFLSWEYAWVIAGNVITADFSATTGFIYEIFITKISGGIGRQECEGHLVDTPVFIQPTNINPNGYERPIVPIPSMTIMFLMDTPLLRNRDATENNGAVFYACGTPRTNSSQSWGGVGLYVEKVGWEHVADFTKPATMGNVWGVNGVEDGVLPSASTTVKDATNTITVDLYTSDGFVPTLESVSTTDIENGANAILVGDEVIQFETQVRVDGFPSRWTLSNLWRGRRGTDYALGTHAANERFALLNEAVQAIPISLDDQNQERTYKAVTFGQSLDDAAEVDFTWTGRSLQTQPIENFTAYKSSDLWAFTFTGEADAEQKYIVKVLTSAGSETLPNGRTRKMAIIPGTANPVLFESSTSTTTTTAKPFGSQLIESSYTGGNDANGLCRSLLTLDDPGFFIEFTVPNISKSATSLNAAIGLADAGDAIASPTFFYVFSMSYVDVFDDPSRFWAIQLTIEERRPGGSVASIYFVQNKDTSAHRYRIQSSGSEVQFFRNHTGPGSRSIATSRIALPSNLKIFASGGLQNIVLGGLDVPYTTYTDAQQEEDFTAVQANLRVRAYQESHGVEGIVREVSF